MRSAFEAASREPLVSINWPNQRCVCVCHVIPVLYQRRMRRCTLRRLGCFSITHHPFPEHARAPYKQCSTTVTTSASTSLRWPGQPASARRTMMYIYTYTNRSRTCHVGPWRTFPVIASFFLILSVSRARPEKTDKSRRGTRDKYEAFVPSVQSHSQGV